MAFGRYHGVLRWSDYETQLRGRGWEVPKNTLFQYLFLLEAAKTGVQQSSPVD